MDKNDREWSQVRRRWAASASAVFIVFSLLSTVRIDSAGGWRVQFAVTTTTAVFLGLAMIPLALEWLVDRGGRLLLPGGLELQLDHREVREVGLPGTSATSAALIPRLTAHAVAYNNARSTASSFERTQRMEAVLAEARLLSGPGWAVLPDRLRAFRDADDGERVVTLALLEGSVAAPDLAFDVVLSALQAPRSAFEDYHLLRVLWLHRAEAERRRAFLVERLQEPEIRERWGPGSDRRGLARRLLDHLDRQSSGTS